MRKLAVAFSILAIGTSIGFADPHEDREALMKSFGKALGPVFPMMKNEAPFDAAAVQAALSGLSEQTQKLDVAALFPEGTASKGTSPKIWESLADFTEKAEKLKTTAAAAAAAPAADLAGLKTQMGGIFATCDGCHEVYRLKTD